MPDMTPIANQINVPNGVNAFANVVGLKTAMAQSQQEQQKNQELTALHGFISKAMQDPAYKNPDGSPNTQKFQQDAMAVAPTYGQPYIGQASANFNEGIANRQALLNLGNDQRKTIGGFFGQVAANPNASKADMLDAIEQAREQSNDPGYQRSLDSALLHMPSTAGMNMADESNTIRQFSRGVAQQFQAPNASQSDPNIQLLQTTSGQVPTNTNIQSPVGAAPVGKPVPGTNPQQLAFMQGQAGGISDRANAGKQAANAAPGAIDALSRIKDILDKGTWTGTAFSGFAQLKNLAASMGIDTSNATNASELMKNIARYESMRGNTVGNTDASRELFNASGPNYKMDANAVRDVTDQALANEHYILGYGKLMSSSKDPNALTQKENAYRNVSNLIPALEAGQMKSPAEMEAFLKRYNLSASDLAKARQQLREMGAL